MTLTITVTTVSFGTRRFRGRVSMNPLVHVPFPRGAKALPEGYAPSYNRRLLWAKSPQ